jgi:hypothetical protein
MMHFTPGPRLVNFRDVFKYFSQLETSEGDMMIRFNMQIYPNLHAFFLG